MKWTCHQKIYHMKGTTGMIARVKFQNCFSNNYKKIKLLYKEDATNNFCFYTTTVFSQDTSMIVGG